MAELSNYAVDDLRRLAIEQLVVFLTAPRPRALAAVDKAADAVWELRLRHRTLANPGVPDIGGTSSAYRAEVARIYDTAAATALGTVRGRDKIQAAIQRRMKERREAWEEEQS